MAIRVRTCRDLEGYRTAMGAIGHYFGWVPTDEDAERFSKLLPLERMQAVLDDGRIVGGTGVFPFELTIPGGSIPCAGVTVVGVLPSHRRRGLMTRMMRAQHDDIRERGEPLAVLWASDERIYGRHGYGLASLSLEMKVRRSSAQLRAELPGKEGSVRLVDHDEALRVLPRVYERVRSRIPGFISRSRDWWEVRTLGDLERNRRGAGPLNRAVLELGGRPAGYAIYRIKRDFDEWKGTVKVIEAIGVDSAATREIWRFLFEIDWMDEITGWLLPVDHPLVLQAARMTQLGLELQDGLWVRLVDVGAALSGRGYGGDGRVTLEVTTDPLFPDNVGTWTIEDGAARRSRRRPDVQLDVQALGSAYLGGFSFAQLARAELVHEVARGGVARADGMFRSDRAPWCPEPF